MNRLLEGITGKYRALTIIVLTAIIAVVLTASTQNQTTTIIVSGVICVLLFITRPVWLPENHGKTKVRVLSLTFAFAAIGSFFFWKQLVQEVAIGFIKQFDANIANKLERFEVVPVIALLFLLAVIALVNYWMRDKTAMGIHEKPIKEDIPDLNFNERLIGVVNSLSDDLRSIDIQTNWSASLFTPLDAEVEVTRGSNREKRVTDLLKAIKRSKERLFLVIGDPGSGKSVALRKLAQDLAKEKEVMKTGKIPVYINLKEWVVDKEWTEELPPTVHELNDFVKENLMGRDIVTSKFFRDYYEKLYETGRLYFILDSFDEIPAVLDEQENSELIKKLSAVIFKFLKGARSKESQGILASRVFRKPTRDFQTNVSLEIRPFTEQKIINTLRRSKVYNDELIKRLFKERSELVPVARNPFMATLISDYTEHNNNRLPSNQSEMYESYISRTLDACQNRMNKRGISKAQIIECCIGMADLMFEDYGLEIPIHKARIRLPDLPIEDAIEILKFARLGRLGSSDESRFSFVHRRFAEYFAVQKVLQENYAVDFEAIPSDSRYRDALVLYCEVAEEEKATAIADFCWSCIQDAENRTRLEVIHALRFLNDAFKGRKECLKSIQGDLAEYILIILEERKDLMKSKLATEGLNLLEDKDLQVGVLFSLESMNTWLAETAIKACRSLPQLNENLEVRIAQYIIEEDFFLFIKNYKNYRFSFKLAESFNSIKKVTNLKLLSYIGPLVVIFLLMSQHFFITIGVVTFFVGFSFILRKLVVYFPPNDYTKLIAYLIITSVLCWIFFSNIPAPEEIQLSDYFKPSFVLGFLGNVFTLVVLLIPPYLFIRMKSNNKYLYSCLYEPERPSFNWVAIKSTIKNTIINFGKFMPRGILIMIVMIPIALLLEKYINRDDFILFFIGGLLFIMTMGMTFIFIYFIYLIIFYFRKINRERKWMIDILEANPNRETLYEIYNTAHRRNKFLLIKHIQNTNLEITGEYHDIYKISVSSDRVDTMLAQLEEKWLGLDR